MEGTVGNHVGGEQRPSNLGEGAVGTIPKTPSLAPHKGSKHDSHTDMHRAYRTAGLSLQEESARPRLPSVLVWKGQTIANQTRQIRSPTALAVLFRARRTLATNPVSNSSLAKPANVTRSL